MSNKKEVKGTAPKSNTPMLIIGVVALVAVLGGWWMYSSSKSGPATNTNSNSTAKNTQQPKSPGIPPNAPAGANPPNQTGSPTAAVTIEEFADFQCGSCAAAHPVVNEIKSTYGSRIRFIFRNYPLSIPAHDKAYEAAVAVEAAGLQGKFWDMQNLLFNNQQTWTAAPTYKTMWKEYATKVGLDVPKWENDMAGLSAKSRVDADMARGKAIGVNSTPSFYVNGNAVPYAEATVAGLKKLIDGELAKANPAAATAPAANTAAPGNAANASK
ncbi:MAG: thioredoxin domain-containing protein [Acidobacteria bacterium]|jgi:protein-disulfide isomerase|nr:thioredoxin domain-containing protein [Acidobacteriota bacterium]MBP7475851.1 thioredoxin domain-containing protein [Pyrinomonadaceae bacterium]